MGMKGVWALSIVLAFVAGSILTGSMAYAVPNGQPFQALWDAITDLQGQIDTIELTPGPQGETGPQGATGSTGPVGETGPAKTFAEFTGSVLAIDNRASNILTVECSVEHPFYQYDSGFSRSTSDGTLVKMSEDIIWDGDKMSSITDYVAMFRDISLEKSITCSNVP